MNHVFSDVVSCSFSEATLSNVEWVAPLMTGQQQQILTSSISSVTITILQTVIEQNKSVITLIILIMMTSKVLGCMKDILLAIYSSAVSTE